MKIITEPSVYLVGRQAVDYDEMSRFLADEGVESWTTDTSVGGEQLIEVAGRLCYMSFAKPRPGGNRAYIDHILEVGHGSVVEHEVYNLIFTGVSRSLTHELVRHRAGFSYSQLSQRYVDESDVAFVVPPALQEAYAEYLRVESNDGAYDSCKEDEYWAGQKFHSALMTAHSRYSSLATYLLRKQDASLDLTTRRKAAREAARSVLPNCTETKIFVTANARALRHFLEMRGSSQADAEIRRLAIALHAVLVKASPNVFGDYILGCVGGVEFLSTPTPKV